MSDLPSSPQPAPVHYIRHPQPSSTKLKPGKRWDRLVAAILDNFFIGLMVIPLILVFQLILDRKLTFTEESINSLFENVYFVILIFIITNAYKIGFLMRDQATPAKKWRHLKVVTYSDGSPLATWRIVARSLFDHLYYLPIVGIVLQIISNCLVLFTPTRRALHDLVVGSYVVEE